MKIPGMAMAAILSGAVWGSANPVTVCMGGGNELEEVRDMESRARAVADGVFGRAGVGMRWHAAENCPEHAIQIDLSTHSVATEHPGAFAYARPYEGTHIVVFVDRVSRAVDVRTAPCLLGYVIAHEVAHILEGIVRHSDRGVMKAVWSVEDYRKMEWQQLGFAPEDIVLIHTGLSERALSALQ